MATADQIHHYTELAAQALRMVMPAANDGDGDELSAAIYAVARTAEQYGRSSLQCIVARRELAAMVGSMFDQESGGRA